jgi:hypothetical protein
MEDGNYADLLSEDVLFDLVNTDLRYEEETSKEISKGDQAEDSGHIEDSCGETENEKTKEAVDQSIIVKSPENTNDQGPETKHEDNDYYGKMADNIDYNSEEAELQKQKVTAEDQSDKGEHGCINPRQNVVMEEEFRKREVNKLNSVESEDLSQNKETSGQTDEQETSKEISKGDQAEDSGHIEDSCEETENEKTKEAVDQSIIVKSPENTNDQGPETKHEDNDYYGKTADNIDYNSVESEDLSQNKETSGQTDEQETVNESNDKIVSQHSEHVEEGVGEKNTNVDNDKAPADLDPKETPEDRTHQGNIKDHSHKQTIEHGHSEQNENMKQNEENVSNHEKQNKAILSEFHKNQADNDCNVERKTIDMDPTESFIDDTTENFEFDTNTTEDLDAQVQRLHVPTVYCWPIKEQKNSTETCISHIPTLYELAKQALKKKKFLLRANVRKRTRKDAKSCRAKAGRLKMSSFACECLRIILIKYTLNN